MFILKKVYFLILLIFLVSCNNFKEEKRYSYESSDDHKNYKIHFIELGSVDCVPCKMMQPVMENIKKRFGEQVKITFYDVWTEKHKQYAQIYNINGIPTQVFLAPDGKEIYRHVGFFPEEEIVELFKSLGIEPVK